MCDASFNHSISLFYWRIIGIFYFLEVQLSQANIRKDEHPTSNIVMINTKFIQFCLRWLDLLNGR